MRRKQTFFLLVNEILPVTVRRKQTFAIFFFYLLIAAARRYIKESFFHKVIFLQFSDSKFIKFPLDEVRPNRK